MRWNTRQARIVLLLAITVTALYLLVDTLQRQGKEPSAGSFQNVLQHIPTLLAPVPATLPDVPQVYVGLPQLTLSYCPISKNMNTVLKNIFLYLYDAQSYNLSAGEVKGVWSIPGKVMPKVKNFEHFYSNEWDHLVVIRHPIDRLISAWLHKCYKEKKYCYDCEVNDFSCFVEQTYYRMMKLSRGVKHVRNFYSSNVETHWFPQTWRCHLGTKRDFQFFIKYERHEDFYSRFEYLFRIHHVPEDKMRVIKKFMKKGQVEHSTFNIFENEIRQLKGMLENNCTVLKFLYATYYYDFKMLNYTLPANADTSCFYQ